MTTTEHLQKIRAKCVELLAIAEKRTAGRWQVSGHPSESRRGDAIIAETGETVCEGLRWNERWGHNGPFIASCAGPAEAGWMTTIADVDDILPQIQETDAADGAIESGHKWLLHKRAERLKAAWPEELL